jgi:transposase
MLLLYFHSMIFDLENISKKELVLMLQASELMIKESESRAKESESRAKEYESQVKKQEQIIEQNSQEVQWLKHQIAQLRRMLFGSKRERFEADASQTKIQFEEYANEQEKQDETPVKETITYEREKNTKKHNGRNQIPDSLPVLEHIIEPEEDTTGMRKIGEERTEILEYVPEKFFKLVIIRPKYARLEQNQDLSVNPLLKNVVIANLPSRPIEKCLAGNTLLAAILVNKYVDHLPLYRQQQIFKRADIEIAPSTMDSWVAQLGNLMELLYKKLIQEVKAQTYLQADETTTKVLDRTKKDKTHLGYYWTYHAPLAKLVAFDYQKGRDTDAPREFLQGYRGNLQTDGYAVYKHYYSNEYVIHSACWAHARRKFENALQSNPKLAEYALSEIQKLYIIEREAKELTPEQRKEVRLEKALPIINDFGKWLHDKRQQVLPKSPMGMAIEYVTPLWESLQNYLHDGNLMIDNNLIENTIRPIALGRKNYLFAGSHNGAKRSAMFYSFFACCKLNNINPHKWMEYVLENIADYKSNKLHELLPNNINPETILNFKKFYEV